MLPLGRRSPTQKINYEMGQVQLENLDVARDLGVMIDSELKFSNHCAAIVKKASMRMNCIFRSFENRVTLFLL